jgi:hypothetical protein
LSSIMTTMMTGSHCPCCQRPPPQSLTLSSLSPISLTDADIREEDRQLNCPAGVGGCTTHIAGWGMGGAAHGFALPPPCLAASETATTAASAGGPAGHPPRLRACRQACAAARNDNDNNRVGTREQQRAASGRQHNHRRLLDGGQRQRGQWTRANNNQPLSVEGRQAVACGKSSRRRKGEGRCRQGGQAKRRRITTTTRIRIAQLPPPLPPLLLLPLPPLQATTPAPPILPLIKQWQQCWQHRGAVAAAADSRMPSLTPFLCVSS